MGAGYKTALKDGRIQVINKKLVLYKPIIVDNVFFSLIIVPTYLRQKIFSHFHARPNGGHMGKYKPFIECNFAYFAPESVKT